MGDPMNETELYKTAANRVDAKLGFLIHAVIYLAVNGYMAVSGALSGQFTRSFLWCAGAWTLALLIQGTSVFFDTPRLRQRAIEAEVVRLRAASGRA
jgi:hypothetical protein